MRWLFLLLLVLNVFYYVWHQQEAPLRAKDVTPLSLYRGSQQDIRLLSETKDSTAARDKSRTESADENCLYLGALLARRRQGHSRGVWRRLISRCNSLRLRCQIQPASGCACRRKPGILPMMLPCRSLLMNSMS